MGRPMPNNRKYFLGYDTDNVRQVGLLKSQKITEDNHAFFTDYCLLGEKSSEVNFSHLSGFAL